MPVSFPEVPDIRLGRSPLREVVCQVRFPTLLRIATETPVSFQERIKARFPLLKKEQNLKLEVRGPESEDIEVAPPTTVYRFFDREQICQATLAPDFFALSTKGYVDWLQFAEDLRTVHEVVNAEYDVPYATRIGLRYINRIDSSFTESGEFEDVYPLLRSELTAMLTTGEISSPESSAHRIVVPIEEGDRLAFFYGLIREGSPPKPSFVLDFDVYVEADDIGLGDLVSRCEGYHDTIYWAFRWCIADGKLEAFKPVTSEKGGV